MLSKIVKSVCTFVSGPWVKSLTYFKAKSKILQLVNWELLYADIIAYTEKGMQTKNGPFFKSMHCAQFKQQHKKDEGCVYTNSSSKLCWESEKLLIHNQLCWVQHLRIMGNERYPKHLFYREVTFGKHPRYKLKKHFKVVVKNELKTLEIGVKDRDKETKNRSSWRKLVFDGCNCFQVKKFEHLKFKRVLEKLTWSWKIWVSI